MTRDAPDTDAGEFCASLPSYKVQFLISGEPVVGRRVGVHMLRSLVNLPPEAACDREVATPSIVKRGGGPLQACPRGVRHKA